MQALDRFLAMVDKTASTTGCWNWTGTALRTGYGKFSLDGKKLRVHRVSWLLFNGPIPVGMYVLHSCDNRRCVNPDHLFLGTHSGNMRDMVSKGRQGKGELISQHKLSEQPVIEIRQLYATGNYTHKELAETYNVHPTAIGRIVNRVTWKHIL